MWQKSVFIYLKGETRGATIIWEPRRLERHTNYLTELAGLFILEYVYLNVQMR